MDGGRKAGCASDGDEEGCTEHPDTLMSTWNLYYTLKELHRHVEAISESLLQACVRLQDRLLSPTHLNTVDATADLEAWKNLYSVGSSLSEK